MIATFEANLRTTMARRTLELPLAADRDGAEALTSQIAGQLRNALADGRLATGERLPSTRTLAVLLGVSRTVVTAAYAQLFAEGWVEGRHGSGTFVADGALGRPATRGKLAPVPPLGPGRGTRDGLPELDGTSMIDLRPGIAWTEGIDGAAWRRAWRSAGDGVTGDLPDPRGRADLRTALTGDLRRCREPRPARLAVAAGRPGGRGGAGIPVRPGRVRRTRAAGGAVPGGLRWPAGGRAARRAQACLRHTGSSVSARCPAVRAAQARADRLGQGHRRADRRGRLRRRVPVRRRAAAGPVRHGPRGRGVPGNHDEDPHPGDADRLAGRVARAGRTARRGRRFAWGLGLRARPGRAAQHDHHRRA